MEKMTTCVARFAVLIALASTEIHAATKKLDFVYQERGSRKLHLDLYRPETPPPPRGYPLIISIHGGGWIIGDRGRDIFMLPLVKEGYAVASVQYRLSGEAKYPAQIEDIREATHWLLRHAKELHLDPDRVVVTGASAGGHLALLLAFTQTRQLVPGGSKPLPGKTIKAVCALYPPTDLVGIIPDENQEKSNNLVAALLGAPVSQRMDAARAGSPMSYVGPSNPPVFLVHGDKDNVVPHDQSRMLRDAQRKAGVECTLVTYEDAGHAFRLRPETKAGISRFLARNLAP